MSKHWYTDGNTQVLSAECPSGFHPGRLPVSDETRKKMSEHNAWNTMTEDKIIARNEKISRTIQNRTDEEKQLISSHISNATKGKHIGQIPWNKGVSVTQPPWNRGVPMSDIAKQRLRTVYENLSTEEKSRRASAVSSALSGRTPWNKGKTYTLDPDKVKLSKQKEHLTKKANSSYTTSSKEESFYNELLNYFDFNEIRRQYFDKERYPYNCDFYIKSLDLFIELNFNWTHGGRGFVASDESCQKQLMIWEQKSTDSKYYKNAIYTWTDLDVRKFKCAEINSLNYVRLYTDTDIEKFINILHVLKSSTSKLFSRIYCGNKLCSEAFKNYNLSYSENVTLDNNLFDFKLDSTLVEINPTATHNSTWSPFGSPREKDYHYNKTLVAVENGYRCIHVWDWDDMDKIIQSIFDKTTIYARKCELREVSQKDTNEFLSKYHFQGTCRNQTIRYGLYYDNELVQIMTFGKPRYNKRYDYELLRLCTKFGYKVVGGAEKLFNFFKTHYQNMSIISYCDNSKFSGGVYSRLGMSLESRGVPTRHWYHPAMEIHITDNLLRQRGFDQLFGDIFGNYGKGTSNEELMLLYGFVEIYDCGQSTYVG